MPLISLPDLKSYLGITGTADDTLLASCASNASAMAERDTGRTFAVSSNVTRRYSTDGQSALTIYDVPYTDASRVVTWMGATLTQDVNYWLLPDRRNQDVSTAIQIRYFDTSGTWYKADPDWFDKNLDNPRRYWGAGPNDLVITGVHGHPTLPVDVAEAVTALAAWLYYRAKSGASGAVQTPTGETIDLADYPPTYQRFVDAWRIRTGVGLI